MGRIMVPQAGDLPRCADVVVIGGGVIGCAVGFYATEAGLDTVVLDRRDGLGSLTTAASEECFRAQFEEPENVGMMLESIAVFESFAEVIRVPGYDVNVHQQGYLFLTAADGGPEMLRKRVQRQRACGLSDVQYLDGDEVRRVFPFVGPSVLGATFRLRDGWLSAHELTYGYAKGSSALFALCTAATGIRLDRHGVAGVTTDRGDIATRTVVVAAGPFSSVVLAMVDVRLPLTLLRRQKVILANVPLVPPDAPMTIDQDTGALWRPEVGGAAMAWALPEEPSEPMEQVPTDWTFPAVVLEGAARLVPFWNQVADGLTRENVFLGAGQYTCTPDHKPIIGPSQAVSGLYYSLGYSGHGIMASAGAARLLVDLIIDPSGDDQNPFREERFAESDVAVCAESMVI
jgi:sarcosine oxidase subunit beta